jgi:hypothetical protein
MTTTTHCEHRMLSGRPCCDGSAQCERTAGPEWIGLAACLLSLLTATQLTQAADLEAESTIPTVGFDDTDNGQGTEWSVFADINTTGGFNFNTRDTVSSVTPFVIDTGGGVGTNTSGGRLPITRHPRIKPSRGNLTPATADCVRLALKRGDIATAQQFARVYRLSPVHP